jgi:caffeoyl-CoA O-methyltransferase
VLSTLREPEILQRLRESTRNDPFAVMQVSPEQGQFMAFLAKALNVKNALELGTFTGYSALSVALALPEDGRLVACDISNRWTAMARQFWQEAGVAHKIDLHLRPAIQTLDALIARGEACTFDFAFIDADKENYDQYYERTLTLLRPGGILLIDNVLLNGGVVDSGPHREHSRPRFSRIQIDAMRKLNMKIKDDHRVDETMLSIADGLTLLRKR